MARYVIQCEQAFAVTYVVDAASPEDAWLALLHEGTAECVDQIPSEILGGYADADIALDAIQDSV